MFKNILFLIIYFLYLLNTYSSQINFNLLSQNEILMKIGTSQEEYQFLFALSGDIYNFVIGQECLECVSTKKFNQFSSSSFKKLSNTIDTYEISNYGKIRGYKASDIFSYVNGFEINIEFLYVISIENFYFPKTGYLNFGFSSSIVNDHFIKKKISKPYALFDLTIYNQIENKGFYLGDFTLTNKIKNYSNIIWKDIKFVEPKNNISEIMPALFYLLNKSFDNSFILKNKYIKSWNFNGDFVLNSKLYPAVDKFTINNISTGISIPKNILLSIKDDLFQDSNQIQKNGYFISDCNENINESFKTIQIFNNMVILKPEDYILSLSNSNSKCEILIKIDYLNDFVIFGLVLMDKYYIIFDYTENNQKIGFYKKTNEEDIDSGSSNVLWITMFVIFGSVIFFIIIYFLYKKFFNRNQPEEEVREE